MADQEECAAPNTAMLTKDLEAILVSTGAEIVRLGATGSQQESFARLADDCRAILAEGRPLAALAMAERLSFRAPDHVRSSGAVRTTGLMTR